MKRLATIVLVSALAVLAACGKDKKKDGPAAGSAAAGSAAAGSAAPSAATGSLGQAGAAAGQAGVAAGQAAVAAGQAAIAAGQAADQAAAAGQAAAAAGQAAAAAGQAAAAAGQAAELSEAQVEAIGGRMLALMDSVAGAVEANAADCGAMATAVEKVLADNQAQLAEMKASAGGGANDAKFEAWMMKNQDRATALAARLAPGMTKCSGEARLQDAFSKLDI
jgi:hypothetical protein